MRTLEQIREKNRRTDLLFVGMNDTPIKPPSVIYEQEKDFYKNVIKPSVKRFIHKQISNGNI